MLRDARKVGAGREGMVAEKVCACVHVLAYVCAYVRACWEDEETTEQKERNHAVGDAEDLGQGNRTHTGLRRQSRGCQA